MRFFCGEKRKEGMPGRFAMPQFRSIAFTVSTLFQQIIMQCIPFHTTRSRGKNKRFGSKLSMRLVIRLRDNGAVFRRAGGDVVKGAWPRVTRHRCYVAERRARA